MEAAPFVLKLRMLKAEVMETLLYGCVTWTLCKKHFAEPRTAHHRFLLRIIGFQRRHHTDDLMSYAKVQCESVETTIRKRRLLFAGTLQRTNNERLTRRVLFGTMAGGENPRPGRPERTAQCLVDDPRVFRTTEGSMESVPFVFGVKTVRWPTAVNKSWKWYRGVGEAAECFRTRWHRDEVKSSWLSHATEDAKGGDKGGRGWKGRDSRTDPAVDECRNEMVDRVARYRFD